jgi:N-formylglutamate amidohydrolase
MQAQDPTAWTHAGSEAPPAPFRLSRPAQDTPTTPLIFASPHSGRIYPPSLLAASNLDAAAIRRSEDAYVDDLIAPATSHGITVLAARFARAWIDVNREPWELDPAMFEDELPAYAQGRSARVTAGLGAIARIVGEGQEIYRRKLTFAEAARRVEEVHGPYHTALARLVKECVEAHGLAVLIDWHSMPAAATAQGAGAGTGCDLVLGDRFGAAAAPAISRRVETELKALGYRVARNSPYAGGYTTEHYGKPAAKVHALQIEVSRALYLDEATLKLTPMFARLKANLGRLIARLGATPWSSL